MKRKVRDKARLDWLQRNRGQICYQFYHKSWHVSLIDRDVYVGVGIAPTIRAAIDKAMRESKRTRP